MLDEIIDEIIDRARGGAIYAVVCRRRSAFKDEESVYRQSLTPETFTEASARVKALNSNGASDYLTHTTYEVGLFDDFSDEPPTNFEMTRI